MACRPKGAGPAPEFEPIPAEVVQPILLPGLRERKSGKRELRSDSNSPHGAAAAGGGFEPAMRDGVMAGKRTTSISEQRGLDAYFPDPIRTLCGFSAAFCLFVTRLFGWARFSEFELARCWRNEGISRKPAVDRGIGTVIAFLGTQPSQGCRFGRPTVRSDPASRRAFGFVLERVARFGGGAVRGRLLVLESLVGKTLQMFQRPLPGDDCSP